ncbi:MAG: sterol desaturase family protein, partial [Bacteroidota bacterium]
LESTTFQPEEETPTYGITKPVGSYNPAYLVFHEFIDIVNDIRKSKSFKEAREKAFVRPSKLAQLEAKYAKSEAGLVEDKKEVVAPIE